MITGYVTAYAYACVCSLEVVLWMAHADTGVGLAVMLRVCGQLDRVEQAL